ncbi:MAG: hypothetical protein ACPGYT_04970 [Nitrospirales bacterium]
MNSQLPSPELHLGLTSEPDNESIAWFLAALPQPCTKPLAVTIHFGLIGIGSVLLPLFFLRMSCGSKRLLLETSLNPYHANLQGLLLLRCLCTQESYLLQCRDLTTNTKHTLNLPNTHHALYRQAVNLLESQPPWTASQFIQAQYHLAESWSTPEERFQNLQNSPCPPSSYDT